MTALVSAALACLALLRWDHAPVQLDTTYDGFLTVQTIQPLTVTAEEAGLRIEKTVFIPDPTSDRVSSLTLYGVYTVGGDAGVRQLTGCTAYGVLDNSPGESGWNGFYCIDGTGRYPDRRASVRAGGVMEFPTQVRVGPYSYTHYSRIRTDLSLRYELL